MKILVVADTHRQFHGLNYIVKRNSDADIIIHLGDGEHEFNDICNLYPTKAAVFVKGDVDYADNDEIRVIDVGGYKIFCTHGHRFNVTNGLVPLIEAAKDNKCRIALFGHTHLYRTEVMDGVYLMNPGSIESPRGRNKPTYGVIEISPEGELKMDIVEADYPRKNAYE